MERKGGEWGLGWRQCLGGAGGGWTGAVEGGNTNAP